jgi:prophage maintenance system killer protein
MTREKKKFTQIKSKTICETYKLLQDNNLVSFEITKEAYSKIDSLVNSINSKYFGEEIYNSNEEKAVAYLYFLIKNHPFTDGNKRTAVLVFEIVCNVNNLEANYKDFTLDQLAVFIERQKPENHQKFIKDLVKLLF